MVTKAAATHVNDSATCELSVRVSVCVYTLYLCGDINCETQVGLNMFVRVHFPVT